MSDRRADATATTLTLAVIGGDGIGPEVVAEGLKVLRAAAATKGIDIGSKAAVHAFMSELAASGLSVIMVSSEIPEIMGMADRVIVMREGRIAGEFTGDAMTPENLIRAAVGIERSAA